VALHEIFSLSNSVSQVGIIAPVLHSSFCAALSSQTTKLMNLSETMLGVGCWQWRS